TKGKIEGLHVSPNYLKPWLQDVQGIETKCQAMVDDLEKSQAPAAHPRVKAIHDWIASARPKLQSLREDLEPRMMQAEKIADPKNYPNLAADFEQLDEFRQGYDAENFIDFADRVSALAEQLPQVKTWCGEAFKTYRPLIIVTGGKNSPYYKKYERTAKAIQGFEARAAAFVKQAESEVPRLCEQAETMAEKARSRKMPAFINGGVRQKLDQADRQIRVCQAFMTDDDQRMAEMVTRRAAAEKTVQEVAATMDDEITRSNRLRPETYEGSDLEALRRQIREAWSKAWPEDDILRIVFHMQAFERDVKWTWQAAETAWIKSDHSVLATTVVIKTSAEIATTWPAFVNVDHIKNRQSIGVKTKGGAYVSRKILIENL
ncbi:MAG: hypothetical protein KDB53_03605, partial [Planctomycetes bacterium]|nr:hypothetical protein [Planctomycetota bacterium]